MYADSGYGPKSALDFLWPSVIDQDQYRTLIARVDDFAYTRAL